MPAEEEGYETTLERWFENAVVYCLDVETFQDSDGEGIGDFNGLADRLDYLASLGVTCVWLMPFYPTPNRDNGYDITDYYGVDPRLGSPGDLVACMARTEDGVVFPGVQESTWTYDEAAGAYYHHRFYEHQPDLNIANPAVREEILRVMGFWLAVGVSGFRIDAAPFLVELHGTGGEEGGDHLAYLSEMREFLAWRRGDAILLAEANLEMDHIAHYFGDADRMHLIFNFTVNQQLFLALVRGSASPIAQSLETTRPIPGASQWANFLRNHDELDLGRLPDADREEVFAAIAPDEDMRLYGRGVRRRMAPILGNDPARLGMVPQPADGPARHPGPAIRRGDRHGPRLVARRADVDPGPDAVVPGRQRRILGRHADRLIRPGGDQGDYAY